jgi:hypothetical protein
LKNSTTPRAIGQHDSRYRSNPGFVLERRFREKPEPVTNAGRALPEPSGVLVISVNPMGARVKRARAAQPFAFAASRIRDWRDDTNDGHDDSQ